MTISVKYKSRVGPEILAPVMVVTGGVGLIMAASSIWSGLALIILLLVFIVHMFLNTYYLIKDSTLQVVCGWFYRKKIDISAIRKIESTRNPQSAPALSLDRLEIIYNKYDRIIISPENKTAFIENILRINPGVEIF